MNYADKGFNIQITERDFKILKFLSEVDLATNTILHSAFFEGKSKSAVRSTINRLTLANLIKKITTYQKQAIYSLCSSGVNILRAKFPNRYFCDEIKYIKLDMIQHALDISIIKSAIQRKYSISSWESDRHIKRFHLSDFRRRYYPDAMFKLNNKVFILEYERTLKSKDRIRHKLDCIEYAISDLYKHGIECESLVITASDGIKNSYERINTNSRVNILPFQNINEIEV